MHLSSARLAADAINGQRQMKKGRADSPVHFKS
jgi:hypothetical protein